MESHIVKIKTVLQVTHDVKSFRIEKPNGYQFVAGQATEVAINKPGWENERRPFTFTSLNDEPTLEFTIKRYIGHNSVTNQLHLLVPGDELILHDVWGAIEYKGPGYFIAGGAGITPFIAILRQLHRDNQLAGNTLFFANKTAADVIYEEEFTSMMGKNAVYILSREQKDGYENGTINADYLRSHVTDFNKHFYVCGPDKMVADINASLTTLGAKPDLVVFEK
ncbi:FAD-binding oxidoreductase [Niastella populi]|uniref:Flavodoxin reductase n=1 Tax=Niastella populi TaxID=550983 RepID=A0A1V9FGV1_9BACT|nr:FAD-binding oxidoreductase [Niastella populi]OQP57582.1 flavodoxin reductase [Niastella populi]